MDVKSSFHNRSIISIADMTKDDLLQVIKRAEEFKKKKPRRDLEGFVLATCFYEPSTRTRLSFESAMLRLGGDVIGFSDAQSTSAKKGESLHDAMRVIGQYADAIVLRHPMDGAARCACEATSTPIINAGDGSNQHPTQTLLDLFTIKECQGKLKGLNIAFVGDLKHGRTVHSLAQACALFDIRLFFVSCEDLSLPDDICHSLRKNGVKFSFHQSIEEVLGKVDILYMTRIQKERFNSDAIRCQNNLRLLNPSILSKAKKNLKILHPLPRLDEIDTSIDATPHAYYFEQAENGLYVRQALLSLILKRGK